MADSSIIGRLVDEASGSPASGLRVEAWDTGDLLQQPLGVTTSDAEGVFTLLVTAAVVERLVAARADVFFRVYRGDDIVADTRADVRWHPREPQRVTVPVRATDELVVASYEVRGRIVTDRGSSAGGLRVVAYDKRLKGETVLGQTDTGAGGDYVIAYRSDQLDGKLFADLQVRIFWVARNYQLHALTASKVAYQAPARHVVDLEVGFGDVPRPSEYARLFAALAPLVGDVSLADVDAEGVTYLANRAGWDPRIVAMAVQAERAAAATGIAAAYYYALFRTGVAADPGAAGRLTDERLVQGIEAAVKAGIVGDEQPLDATLEAHRRLAQEAMRAYVPTGGMSTLDALLDLRLDDARKSVFVDQLRASAGAPTALWDGLRQAGFGDDLVSALQTDGKLGFLTLQNASLMRRLVEDIGVKDTADLVAAGLYEARAWVPLVGDSVPAGLTAEAYADGLAAQVRLAHPTLVTADLVRRQSINVGGPDVANAVADFLVAADATHRIGATPLQTWDGFDALAPEAQQCALLVERLHQISPSDASMRALSELGISSARALTRYTETEFLAAHGAAFPSTEEATLTYRKAQDVHAHALNLVTGYLTNRNQPTIHVLASDSDAAAAPLAAPAADAGSSLASATLETLFNNLDFCACEHCRSVLSPAAYLVELLEFLDLTGVPHDGANPIDVLLARRPDLQHLLLSCENTNVALPYVDLVNEVLEHYVVNGDLTNFRGHDTLPGVASADLLADPQFVEAAAYTTLADRVFPAPLPFDMPLEALRLQFRAWGSALADALSLFGPPADTRRERLGLNAAEQSILTDSAFRALPEYFGEPAAATIDALNAAIANAKVFSRRVDVRHQELDRILKTRFVNPGIELVPLLVALHVGLDVVQSWLDGATTDQQLLDQLPDDLNVTPYGGDVLAWLTANEELLMDLIVLAPTDDADPETDECDFGMRELRLARPVPAANALTALEYHRLHRFIRIWRVLDRVVGADIETTDALLVTFLPVAVADLTLVNLDDATATALDRFANFTAMLDEAGVGQKKAAAWLELFDPALDAAARAERLARLLKLGATDFANLAAITGIDPFADDLADDDPSLPGYVRARRLVDHSPLKVDDVDFVLRDGDPAGTRVPSAAAVHADVARLRSELATVDATAGTPTDADLTIAQTRMALVYDQTVVDRFFALLGETATYRVALATVEEDLPTLVTAVSPAVGFDAFTDEVTFTGPMADAVRDGLLNAADTVTLDDVDVIDTQPELDSYIAALKTAITALQASGAADAAGLHTDHPALGAVFDAALATPDPATRAAVILDGILPELRAQLQTIGVRGALATMLRTDEPTVTVLTSGPTVLHGDADATVGVLADLLALETPVAFDHDDTFDVFVDPPATDDFLLSVQAPAGTQITLTVDGAVAIPAGAAGPSGEVVAAAAVAMVAGAPVSVQLTVAGLPVDGAVTLRWRTDGMAKSAIPTSRLIDAAAAHTAGASLLRLHKAVFLATELPLTPGELVFFAATCPDTIDILDDLPVGGPPAAPTVPPVWAKLSALLTFAALKHDKEPDPDTWVGVLESGALGAADGQKQVATIGSWRPADVTDAVTLLGAAGDALKSVTTLQAVRRLADYAVTSGQTVADLIVWSVADPDTTLVDGLHQRVRAALDDAAWRESMHGVNDELRNKRRDALVAYILVHDAPTPEIDTADKLYEHFLLDVEMDACMQTSRIRLALSTVQLFITRCLMNLEPSVSSGSIRQDHWAWMSRYRVWEANRKVFLWPENWLEPELRDGKSPFFHELESDLLKADITTELAEDAYLAYLKKLDDVARLEIVGCFLQQRTPGNPDDDILHVIGRTNGKTRQYWYRRFEFRTYWTPWEKVTLNIEGDLVLPTMWRNQLYLFWVTAVEKPRGGNQDSVGGALADQHWAARARVDVELTLNWGELYRGRWSSPKSTNMHKPLVIRSLQTFHPASLLLFARTHKPEGSSERLVSEVVYYHHDDVKAFMLVFTSKNASPIVFEDTADPELVNDVGRLYEQLFWERQSESTLDSNSLDVPRTELTLRIEQPPNAVSASQDERLLTKTAPFPGWNVRTVMHPVENQWEAPFFYADEHSTFYVEGDESHRTIPEIDEYVPIAIGTVPIHVDEVYEEVISPNPRDPIWNPEWRQLVSPQFTTLLPADVSFELDGVRFDALGLKG
jgi:ABC toxin N-terminal region/Neuraminidase-like domain/Salmonella virulence plasmid 28.1kDa A protein